MDEAAQHSALSTQHSALALHQARNQATTACGAIPVSSNRSTFVGHRFVAFFDHVWFYVGVLRARYFIALARHKTAIETHRFRGSDDFSSVVSLVTEAYEVYHDFTVRVESTLLMLSSWSLSTLRRTSRRLDARFLSAKRTAIYNRSRNCRSPTACFLGDVLVMSSVDQYSRCRANQKF